MSRHYTIEHKQGDRVVWIVTLDDAKEAFNRFVYALADDGHDERTLRLTMQGLTVALMAGMDAFGRLTADLKGSTTISITDI